MFVNGKERESLHVRGKEEGKKNARLSAYQERAFSNDHVAIARG